MPKKPKQPDEAETAVEVAEPRPGLGRPSSFDPDYLRQAEFLCSQGAATDEDMADFFQVTKRTINRWKITHPEFAAAIKRGKDMADDRVEDSLYHKAMEREIEEEQAFKVKKITYGADGKKVAEEERIEVVTVKKLIPADTTAMIFWLKNRRSKAWRDVHKIEHGEAGAFDQMADDELDQMIAGEARALGLLEAPKQETESKANGRGGKTKH